MSQIERRRRFAMALMGVIGGLVPAAMSNAASLTFDADTVTTAAQDGSGTWSTGAGGWWDGVANANFIAGDTVTFGAASGAAGTVTLGTAVTTSNLIFALPGSGNYTLTAGTLALGAGTTTITADASATINSTITRTGVLVKSGAGTLNIFGTTQAGNDGLVTLSQGKIAYSDGVGTINSFGGVAANTITFGDASTGTSAVTLEYVGTNATAATIANNMVVSASGTGDVAIGRAASSSGVDLTHTGTLTLNRGVVLYNNSSGGQLRFSGAITGTGGVTIDGVSGSTVVAFRQAQNANTFSGGLVIRAEGKLQLGANDTTITNQVPDAANVSFLGTNSRFVLSNAGETIGGLTSTGTFGTVTTNRTTAGGGNITLAMNVATTNSFSYGGTITDQSAAGTPWALNLTKSGAGTQTLTGTANSFAGSVALTGGVLQVTKLAAGGSTSSIGKSSAAATSLRFNGGALVYIGAGDSTDRLFQIGTVTNSTVTARVRNDGTLGALSFTNTGSPTFFDGTIGGGVELGGTNTAANTFGLALNDNGSNKIALTKINSGSWTLTNNHSYTGPTSISGGTLLLSSSSSNNPIGSSGTISLASGTTLDVTGVTTAGGFIVGSQVLSGSGAINGSVTTSGGSIVTPGGVSQKGTLTLNNGLALNGGSINYDLASTQTVGSGVNDLIDTAGVFDVTSGTTLAVKTLGLLSPGSYSYRLINYGTSGTWTGALTLDTSALGAGRSSYTLNTTTAGQVNLDVINNSASLKWKGQDGTNPTFWDINTTTNWMNGATGDTYYDGDVLTFDDTATTYNVALQSAVIPGGITVSATNTYSFSGAGIGGQGALVKSGTGTLVLANTGNIYDGATTLTDGVLSVASGAMPTASTISMNGGTLQWNGGSSDDPSSRLSLVTGKVAAFDTNGSSVTFASAIGGDLTSGVTKAGAGTLVITSAQAYTGPTVVNGGTLQVGVGSTTGSLSSGTVTINSGGTLAYYRGASSTATTVSAVLDGAGDVVFNGTGVATHSAYSVSGTNTLSGTMTINSGARVNAASGTPALGTAAVTVNSGGGLFLSVNGTYNNNLSLAGLGWPETQAPGTLGALRLGATSTYAGTITLTGNTRISAYGSTGTISGPITETGGSQSLEIGAATTATTTSMGSVTISNSNNYTGGTAIRNAIVTASNNYAFGTTAITMEGNSGLGTRLQIGDGVTIANNLTVNTGSAQAGRGFLEGPASGTGTYTGSVTFTSGPSGGGNLNGGGAGGTGTLVIMGPITSTPGGLTHRDGTIYYGGGGSYTSLTVTKRAMLAANNGICTTSNITLGGSASATFDLNGYNQEISALLKTTAAFAGNVTNTGVAMGTLTVNNSFADAYTGTIDSNVALTKTGSDVLTLTGSNTYTGPTTVNNGTLKINASTYAPTTTAQASLTVTGSALADIDAASATFTTVRGTNVTVHNGSLLQIATSDGDDVGPGIRGAAGSVSNISNLSLDATSKLDLKNNGLIIPAAGNLNGSAITVDSLRAAIIAGRGGVGTGAATWSGAGGIGTSTFAFDETFDSIGYCWTGDPNLLVGPTDINGESYSAGDYVVKYCAGADADLNGLVDDTDVAVIGLTYDAGATTGHHWYEGDFNYDGLVNDDDVAIIGLAYNPSGTPLSPSFYAALSAEYGASFASAFATGASTVVPEPTSLGLLAIGAMGLIRRRRR